LCTKEEAEEAHIELIKKYHPDRISHLGSEFNRIAESKSKEINQAYELVIQYIKNKKT
jgi:DnaJ like chaperone protein